MKRKMTILGAVLAVLLLAGCSVRTVNEMYRLPKRSEAYNDLQKAIDGAMVGLEYSAPVSGEYRQTVQMADLDGDGVQEYLLFAKGGSEHPLKILLFKEQDKAYRHIHTIECDGIAFDQVHYVQMDEKNGVELVLGRRLDEQMLRVVSVYSFSEGEQEQVASVNYSKLITSDLDGDGTAELFVISPGQNEQEKGTAQLFKLRDGTAEKSAAIHLSEPIGNLRRVAAGTLFGGQTAIYVTSSVRETAIVIDVLTLMGGQLRNVALPDGSEIGAPMIRNFGVFPDDIDGDGETELPSLITPEPAEGMGKREHYDLIRWYTMTPDGGEVDKLFTFHNFDGGWYLELDSSLAEHCSVQRDGNLFRVCAEQDNLLEITAIPNSQWEAAESEDSIPLEKTESMVYVATLGEKAEKYGVTEKSVLNAFHLISPDWKTGDA